MTVDEKTRICQLRLEGKSYGQIAARLNISENTIKSFCQRNKLPVGSVAVLPEATAEPTDNTTCRYCGKRLKQNPKHKPKKFCSDTCRSTWWKEHREQVNKKAVYHITCACCGKEFESYGNNSRKYCGHECYMKDRFGEKTKVGNALDLGAV